MGKLSRGNTKRLLSNTRPKIPQSARDVSRSMSSRATRSLIRSHHVLHKKLKQAENRGDDTEVVQLKKQIEDNGGIQAYQRASVNGQSADRGGDSSKVLVEWIRELRNSGRTDRNVLLRLLEVGSLRVDNACARSGFFVMERIDLNSQHPDIKTQDFMSRPIPEQAVIDNMGFDVISLSLVVNYIPDAEGRGNMLRRCSCFLRPRKSGSSEGPYLFLVLPSPCVLNSRYLTDERLQSILRSLGYQLVRKKVSNKLVYYLFKLERQMAGLQESQIFPKEKIQDGNGMNNFSIVLKGMPDQQRSSSSDQ